MDCNGFLTRSPYPETFSIFFWPYLGGFDPIEREENFESNEAKKRGEKSRETQQVPGFGGMSV